VASDTLDSKTVREIHVILRRALDDAVRRGLLVGNRAQLAHSPKARRLTSAVSRAWNAQQLQAFLQHTKGHRHHPAIWLAANTGLRRSELLALRWGDVDPEEARLSVNGGLFPLPTSYTRQRGRRVARDAASTSIAAPSNICVDGNAAGCAKTHAPRTPMRTSSPRRRATLCTPGYSATRSAGSYRPPAFPTFGFTTYDTLTRRFFSKQASRSKSLANGLVTRRRASRWRPTSTCSQACRRRQRRCSAS
jgi:hypothetical protein